MSRSDVADFSDRTARTTRYEPRDRSYRRSSRTNTHRAVAIYPRDARGGRLRRTVARLRDYSASGIGLVSGQAVAPGTQFAMRLVGQDGRKIGVVFEVVYCQPTAGGTFQLGATLPTPVAVPPQPAAPAPVAPERPESFDTSIMGKTVSGWERVLDMRADDHDRLWINMHPPDRDSGWGMFVDRKAIESVLLGAPLVPAA